MLVDIKTTEFYAAISANIEENANHQLKQMIDELHNTLKQLSLNIGQRVNLKHIFKQFDQDKYRVHINLCTHSIKKARIRRQISNDKKCMARTGLCKQCSRSRIGRSEYCKSHNITLPYGRIDGPLEGKAVKMSKKRGRKTRKARTFTLDELDIDQYVQATIHNIDDRVVLMDHNGVLYEHDDHHTIIGKVIDDGIEWY